MAIRTAIIGAGVMGADHARIIATQVPGATLQVVCDADPARAEAVAAETGAARAASDALATVAAGDVDAVLIASPDATHAPLTLACIAAGKPVLCEKPLAPDSAACLAVVAAEVQAGRRLVQVGFMRRFDPSYTAAKATLASGVIGRALMFHCFHRNVAAPSWFTSEMAITNSAPHEFDIARWMLDTDYADISVFQPRGADRARPGAPVVAVLNTTGGQLVTIEVTVNAGYGYDVRGEVVGESGTVALRQPFASETSVAMVQGLSYPADWRPRFAEAYRLQNQAWIASIRNDRPTGASSWDGYAATRASEAGIKALASGGAMAVTMAERPALHRD